MRLIDADALKKEWSLGDKCEECPQNAWKCQFEQNLTQMDICQMLDDAPTVGEWISVEDRLPENEKVVICYTPCDGYMFVGFYRTSKSKSYEWSSWQIITAMRSTKTITKKVTHWMPLPEPPEEVNDERTQG